MTRPVCDRCKVKRTLSPDAEGKMVSCATGGNRWAPRVPEACRAFEPEDEPTNDEHPIGWGGSRYE